MAGVNLFVLQVNGIVWGTSLEKDDNISDKSKQSSNCLVFQKVKESHISLNNTNSLH